MFCKNCGTESAGTKKFCTNCGIPFSVAQSSETTPQPKPVRPPMPKEPWTTGRIIKTVVAVVFVGGLVFLKFGLGAINSVDNSAVEKNNTALDSFNSGNSDQAISQFQQAQNSAVTNSTKITTLKNLAYVYATDGKNDEALSAFQEALNLTSQNSFDYYLISAEIALLQGKPNSAYISFNKALELEPDDFQVNNSLAIFYMNLDGSSAEYENYPKALTFALKANNLSNSEITRENLGIAYFWNDNYDQSIAILSQTNIAQHPYIGFWLGYDYAAKKDVTRAKTYFRQAINAGGTPPQEVTDYLNNN